MATDPIDHARQVAVVTSIISAAFDTIGLQCTLVGGSAIEVHAPGVLKSGDIDLVIESPRSEPGVYERLGPVFNALGFTKRGRHWQRSDLLVEVPSVQLVDPVEDVRVGSVTLRVLAKEVLLAERIVGFMEWKQTSYGQQAIDMLAALGDSLDMNDLAMRVAREGATEALSALRELSVSDEPVSEQSLQALLERLAGRPRS